MIVEHLHVEVRLKVSAYLDVCLFKHLKVIAVVILFFYHVLIKLRGLSVLILSSESNSNGLN